jgi:hypothetical protein
MITFKLKSGRKISLISFSFNYTYSGLLIGIPTKEINNNIISKSKYPAEWGYRPILKIIPKPSAIKNKLKPICYCALLESDKINSADTTSDGSSLVVIWYGGYQKNKTIKEILKTSLKNINWDSHAENFNF